MNIYISDRIQFKVLISVLRSNLV